MNKSERTLLNHCLVGDMVSVLTLYRKTLELGTPLNLSVDQDAPFRIACANGHVLLAKWLYQTKPDIDMSVDDYFCLRWACIRGHLLIAKWLVTIIPAVEQLGPYVEGAFIGAFGVACTNGNLDMAKWVYQYASVRTALHQPVVLPEYDHMDQPAEFQCIVRSACEHGRLDVLKWLIEVYPTMDIPVLTLFQLACAKNQITTAQWLRANFNFELTFDCTKITHQYGAFVPYNIDELTLTAKANTLRFSCLL
jgi:hypothetical protein